jgi:fibronectin type 3 domain-containing protein
MKKILILFLLTLISCSVSEQCGIVTKKETTINPSCILVTVQFDDGRIETLLTSDLSTQVGDYKCY